MKTTKLSWLWCTCLIFVFLSFRLHAQKYNITDLGAVWGTNSYAYGINNQGQVVGYWTSSDGATAFLYSGGTMSNLGSLGGTNQYALSINSSGKIVGFGQVVNGPFRAFLYENGGINNLGALGGDNSYAYGINDNGQIVGYIDITGGKRAFTYGGSGVTNLGTLGGTESFAFGVNNSNLVVGSSSTAIQATNAFLWQNGVLVNLNDTLPANSGWVLIDARGINNSGNVVGWGTTNNQEQAFFYDAGQVTRIGMLSGATNSFAFGINNSNQVVGVSTLSDGTSKAFIWANGSMTNLNDLVPPTASWDLREARGINDLGEIVGWGVINGQEHAFLLSPNAQPSVVITNPTNNAVLVGPLNLTLQTTAIDGDGAVSKVEFFQGTSLSGEDSSDPFSHTVNSVQEGAYAFKAIATDNSGAKGTSAVVNVTVAIPPGIATSPQSQRIITGNNVTFNVVANGTTPLSYQWRFNGEDIFGVTQSSYSIANVQTIHAGSYAVVVTNIVGSITSTPVSLTVTVDPLNMGKGDWIYFLSDATNRLGQNVPTVTNIPSLMAYERLQGMQFIVVKAGDGGTIWNQFDSNLVHQAHAAGLKIFGYGRVFGTDIPGEIAVATNVLGLGADGFIIDAEIEYESQILSTNVAAATMYCQGIRSSYPDAFIAYSPFVYITAHATFPYTTFGRYCDAVMPQCYWKSFGKSVSNMVYDLNYEWTTWQNSLTGTNTEAIQPIVPIGQGWSPTAMNPTTGAEIAEFISRLKTNANPATAGGYKGVSFWRADLHSPDMWDRLGPAIIGNPTGAPLITAQPQSQTIVNGQPMTFTVQSTGTAPLNYQWRLNGGNISGATTSSYSVGSVQSSDVGVYSVIVSNALGVVLSADAILSIPAYALWTETFENSGLNNWTIVSGASALTNSSAQNHTTSGTNGAKIGSTLNKMYRNTGVEMEGNARVTFWIYDSTQTRAFGEVRSHSGSGYGSGSLQQIFAIGRYHVGFGTGTGNLASEVLDTTKYQGRVFAGSNAGWFNLNASGAPNRSAGWHKFEIERLSDGTTIKFYVDGVLGRTISNATSTTWDSMAMGSVAAGSTSGDAWFDDIKPEYVGVPTISSQPTSQTVNAGANVSFSVTATGNVTGYQWRLNGNNIAGATSATLNLSNVQNVNAGDYTVLVKNGAGATVSSIAVLTVLYPPVIVTHPLTQWGNEGGNVMFRVVVGGPGPFIYQWKRNGTNLVNGATISGATTDELTLSNLCQNDKATYSVSVTNAAGYAESDAAALYVNGPLIFFDDFENDLVHWTNVPNATWLVASETQENPVSGGKTAYLTNSLNKVYHNLGTEVSSRARATFWIYDDSGTQTRSYGELRAFSGSGLNSGGLQQIIAVGNYKVPFDGHTGMLVNESMDESRYQARIFSGANTGWLNLNGPNAPYRSSGWHQFTAEKSGDGTVLHFFVDGELSRTIHGVSSAAWDTIEIGSAGIGSGVLGDAWFDDVKVETLTAVITTQPIGSTNLVGSSASFTVGATGSGLTYQWRKDGQNIAGATTATLSLSNVQSADEADYSVMVRTTTDNEYSALAPLVIATTPTINNQPDNITVNAGGTAQFAVFASGGGLSYQWRKNGSNISNGGNVAGATTSSLTLSNVSQSDAAAYSVLVANIAGAVTSSSATLTVIDPPVITTQPQSQTVNAGASLTFTVSASGTTPFNYQWRKNGGNISGATTSSLTLNDVRMANAGTYTVLVSNGAGATNSANAVLTVIDPVIISQPVSQTTGAGTSVSFSVTAVGTTPLTYQWRKNSVNISGANSSSLALNNVTQNNAGNYSVVVNNSAGNVTSSVAVLTVIDPPIILTGPENQTVEPYSTAELSVSASGTGLNFQWKKNGMNLVNDENVSGVHSSTLTIDLVGPSEVDLYTVEVSNAGGLQQANAMVSIVGFDSDYDGQNDAEEIANGTDPFDPNDVTCVRMAHWTFDAVANRWTGEGNANDILGESDGTIMNGVSFTTGFSGQAFQFDGADDFVDFGADAGNFNTADFAMEFRIKTESERDEGLFCKQTDGATGLYWELKLIGGVISLEGHDGLTPFNVIGEDQVNDGNFHTVRVERKGTILSIYIDGVLDQASNIGSIDFTSTGSLKMGETDFGSAHFTGVLDEIQFALLGWLEGDRQQQPNSVNEAIIANSWNNNALGLNTFGPAFLSYNEIEADGRANFNGSRGTVRLWVSPHTQNPEGPLFMSSGCGNYVWTLSIVEDSLQLSTSEHTSIEIIHFSHPVPSWAVGSWHQIAVIYSELETRLYIDGELKATGDGIPFATPWEDRCDLFIGCSGMQSANLDIDEVETFNCRLSPTQITGDFQSIQEDFELKASQQITFPPLTNKKYNDAPFTLNATASSGLPVTFTVVSGPATVLGNVLTITGVGEVKIRATQLGSDDCYPASPVERKFAVSKAVLTVTADNKTRAYGASNPELTVSYSGFASGETQSVLTGQPIVRTSASPVSGVAGSPFPIYITKGNLDSPHYTFNFVNGELAVTKALLTVTANNASKTYGTANPMFTASYSGFVNGNSETVLSGQPSISSAATVSSGVAGSPYGIIPSQGTLAAANYSFEFIPGGLTVTKAPLIVKADDKSKLYGAANPALTLSYSGFVNGDTKESALTGAPILTTTADESSDEAGSPYLITVSQGTLAAANYDFTFVSGYLTVNVLPVIATQPASQTINQGNGVTFTVVATGNYPLNYQWAKNGVPIGCATDSSYTIPSVVSSDEGSYSVVVSQPSGQISSSDAVLTVATDNVALDVDMTFGGAVITREPNAATYPRNTVVVLTVAALNHGYRLSGWSDDANDVVFRGPTLFSESDFTDLPALATRLKNPPLDDNLSAYVYLNISSLTKSYLDDLNNPASASSAAYWLAWDLNQLINQNVSIYEQNRFEGVDYSPVTEMLLARTVQGTALVCRNRLLLEDAYPQIAKGRDHLIVLMTKDIHVTANFVSVANELVVDEHVNGQTEYPNGSVSGYGDSLVSGPVANAYRNYHRTLDSIIATRPNAEEVFVPFVAAPGTYDIDIWYVAGQSRSANVPVRINSPAPDPNNTSIPYARNIVLDQTQNGSDWYCLAQGVPCTVYIDPPEWPWDPFFGILSTIQNDVNIRIGNNTGETNKTVVSDAIRLRYVNVPPYITGHPKSRIAPLGGEATFCVGASGKGPLTYVWQFNGSDIPGATDPSFTVQNVQNSGQYRVRITNPDTQTTVSQEATLSIAGAPTITGHPSNLTVCESAPATFHVEATGTGISYQWKSSPNGTTWTDIAGAIACDYTLAHSSSSQNGYYYKVEVKGLFGSTTSSSAQLTVLTEPLIDAQPQNTTVCIDNSATLSVVASGTAAKTYQWQRNGVAINGATTATHTLTPTLADVGSSTYQVVVASSCGTVISSPATVTIKKGLSLNAELQDQLVCSGDSVTFNVNVVGSLPVTYRWSKAATPGGVATLIPGATSDTFTITAASRSAHSGCYSVVIGNTCEEITASACLVVNCAPTLSHIEPIRVDSDGIGFNFSSSTLLSASDAHDSDLDALSFVVEEVLNGQLLIGGLPFLAASGSSSGNCIISPGVSATWIPSGPVTANGTDAFRVHVTDGTLNSEGSAIVRIIPTPKAYLMAWGDNTLGTLGNGESHPWEDYSYRKYIQPFPTKVKDLDDVVTVGTSGYWWHAAAVTANGRLWMWGPDAGTGSFGQGWPTDLTDFSAGGIAGGMIPHVRPTKVRMFDDNGALQDFDNVIDISVGNDFIFAIRSDGTLWSWGINNNGQLGYQINPEDAITGWFDWPATQKARRITGFKDQDQNELGIVQAVADKNGAGLALCADGSVWWWGVIHLTQIIPDNANSPPWRNESYFRYLPETIERNDGEWNPAPPTRQVAFDIGYPVVQVAGARGHYLALRQDGTVWEFGFMPRMSLTDPPCQEEHVSDIYANYCWFRETPEMVPGLPEGIKVTSIAADEYCGLALLEDGSVYAWGSLGYSAWSSTVAEQISKLKNISRISVNDGHAMAIDKKGRIWTWGSNDSVQLAPGAPLLTSIEPVMVYGIENAKDIIVGGNSVFVKATLEEGKPIGLTAVGKHQGVHLNWNSYDGASSYKIYRSLESGGAYAEVGTSSVNNHLDSGLINGTAYYYVVSALVDGVESLQSAEASATPLPVPGARQMDSAIAKCRSIRLNWSPVTSGEVTGYKIYRAVSSIATGVMIGGTNATPTPTFVDYPSGNAQYYYYVHSVNSAGDSLPSNRVGAQLNDEVCPAQPSITELEVTDDEQITLKWTAAEPDPEAFILKYWVDLHIPLSLAHFKDRRIELSECFIVDLGNGLKEYTYVLGSPPHPETEQHYSFLVKSRKTWFKIASILDEEEGPESNIAGPVVPCANCVPDVPQKVQAIGGYEQIYLEWRDDSKADSYTVEYKVNESSTWTAITEIREARFWHTGLTSGTTYHYRVTAVGPPGYLNLDPGQPSAPSAEVSAAPHDNVPDAPTFSDFVATGYDSMVYIKWKVLPSCRSFVERKAGSGDYEAISGTSTSTPAAFLAFLDRDVVNGTTYTYRVVALDSEYHRFYHPLPASTGISVTPSAQTDFTVIPEPGNGHVILNWAPVGAQQFYIKHSLKAGGPYDIVGTVDGAVTSFTHANLQNGVDHYYVVSLQIPLIDQIVDSQEIVVRPLATLRPMAPTNFKVEPIDGKFILSWQPSSGAVKYEVVLAGGNIPIYSGASSRFIYDPYPNPDENLSSHSGTEFTFSLKAISSANVESDPVQYMAEYNAPQTGLDTAATVALFVGDHKAEANSQTLDLRGPTNLLLRASLQMKTESAANVTFQFYAISNGEERLISSVEGHQAETTWFSVPSGLHDIKAVAVTRSGGPVNLPGATYTSPVCSIDVRTVPKLATFKTSAVDLQLPAPGLPIFVSRSYDSQTIDSMGILGKGWRAGWESSLQLDHALADGWVEAGTDILSRYYIGTSKSHLVTVNLPGGNSVYFGAQLTVDGDPRVQIEGAIKLKFIPFAENQGTLSCFMVDLGVVGPTDPNFEWTDEPLTLVTDIEERTDFAPPIFVYTSPEGEEYTFDMSYNGRLNTIVDRNGNSLTYSYHQTSGQLVSIAHSNGRKVEFEYGSVESQAIRGVLVDGRWINVYDTMVQKGEGLPVTKYFVETLDGSHLYLRQVSKLVDRANGGVYESTTYSYGTQVQPPVEPDVDDEDRLTEVYDARGVRALLNKYGNDDATPPVSDGRLVKQTDAAGYETDFTLDQNGKLEVRQGSDTATVNHDSSGRVANILDPTNLESPGVTLSYDDRGRLVTKTDATGKSGSIQYDSKDRPVGQSDALGNSTSSELNQYGQPLSTKDARGNTTSFNYDNEGNLLGSTDTANTETEVIYRDPIKNGETIIAAGLVQAEKRKATGVPYTVVTEYTYYDGTEGTYSLKGELKSVKEKWENDGVEMAPFVPATVYEYDANGNRTKEIRRGTVDGIANVPLVTEYIYDPQNRLVKTIDPKNRETTTEYNEFGKVRNTKDALSRETSYVYDVVGNLIETVYPESAEGAGHTVTRTVYDEKNRPLFSQKRAADGNTTTAPAIKKYYDASGRIVGVEQRSNVQLERGMEVPVTMTVVNEGTLISYTRTKYDLNGKVKYTLDARGIVAENIYDDAGRCTSVKVYTSSQPAFLEDDFVPTGNFQETTYGYDPNGNQAWVRDAAQQTQPEDENHRTEFVYDGANRLVRTWFPLVAGDTERKSRGAVYDGLGRRLRETDEAGVVTAFTYDFRGLLTSVTQDAGTPGSITTLYDYEERGNQIAQTDAKNHTTRYEYDELGRRTKRILPDNLFEEITYSEVPIGADVRVQQKTVTDFRGNAITYLHDRLDRLSMKSLPVINDSLNESGTTINYSYYELPGEPIGSLKQVVMSGDISRITHYAYDDLRRLRKKDSPEGIVSYTHTPDNSVETIKGYRRSAATSADVNPMGTPDVFMEYQYDKLGRLEFAIDHTLTSGTTTYHYDANGNLKDFVYPNNVRHEYYYTEQNRLKSLIVTNAGGGLLRKYDYQLGKTGNRTAVTESEWMSNVTVPRRRVTYDYDQIYSSPALNIARVYRLTKESLFNAADVPVGTIAHTYDQIGNRINRDVDLSFPPTEAMANQSFTYDRRDLIDGDANPNNGNDYYDFNGNTLKDESGVATGDFYDAENHLIKRGSNIKITYDHEGNRVKKETASGTTYYLVDDLNLSGYVQVLAEYPSLPDAAPERTYTYGHDLIGCKLNSATHYYGYDGHGSVRILMGDEVGPEITDTYDYDAYGKLVAQTYTGGFPTLNNYRYTGEQWDSDLGMYSLRARYYRPEIVRFWTMDSFEGYKSEPGSLHKYLYCNGNPINSVDPSGLMTSTEVTVATAISVSLSVWANVTVVRTGNAIKEGADLQALAKRLGVKVKYEEKDPGYMYFLHGTSIRTWGKSLRIDPEAGTGDFGYGFYTFSDLDEDAHYWASDRAKQAEHGIFDIGFVLAVKIKIEDYDKLSKMDFTKPENEVGWKPFVEDCRGKKRKYGNRDVIIGPVASPGYGGWRLHPHIKIPQYKFETGGAAKLQFAYVYPAGPLE